MQKETDVLWEEPIRAFRERALPVPARLAGYSALIRTLDLPVPLHPLMAAVAPKNLRQKEDGWAIYPAPSYPGDTVVDHLIFALKYEGVQLLTLKAAFRVLGPDALTDSLRLKPTSSYLRRLAFLYEWLTDDRLPVGQTPRVGYADIIDTDLQYATETYVNDTRFRIRNNLPGTRLFCPLVSRTAKLDDFMSERLDEKARKIVDHASPALISRAAAFILLSDSKASFAIEGEDPPRDRIARWGAVIGRAGRTELSEARLEELQRTVVGNDRFVALGFRTEGGFIGRHDAFGHPEPDHISAKAVDLSSLMAGLLDFDRSAAQLRFHPVLTAACLAFGFVYIHPFEDGNGRLHRFLMHHVLAERSYTPAGIAFPISTAILDDIVRYKDVLESVSRPLLSWISWEPSHKGNVIVRNDTADYYRYFDATAHCEYLFRCVQKAVEHDLPRELSFLQHRDAFHAQVTQVVDMGERKLDLLIRFLRQNHGALSKRARSAEFAALTDDEAHAIEAVYSDLFG